MFRESYVGQYRFWKSQPGHHEVVTSVANPILAPPKKLIKGYHDLRKQQKGVQDEVLEEWWNEVYVTGYMEKIRNSQPARQRLSWLAWKEHDLRMKKGGDLWIICYEGPKVLQGTEHCHRFIILDLLKNQREIYE